MHHQASSHHRANCYHAPCRRGGYGIVSHRSKLESGLIADPVDASMNTTHCFSHGAELLIKNTLNIPQAAFAICSRNRGAAGEAIRASWRKVCGHHTLIREGADAGRYCIKIFVVGTLHSSSQTRGPFGDSPIMWTWPFVNQSSRPWAYRPEKSLRLSVESTIIAE